MKILALISLGIGVGSGHLSRSLKLIDQLKGKNKKDVLFILNKKVYFKDKNYQFDFANFKKENLILKKILRFKPNLIIIDSYILSYKLNKKIYNLNKNIISIDDNLKKKHICKYYINYNFLSKNLQKTIGKKVISENNFIGPKYFFSNNQNSGNFKNNKKKVLVFLGSTNEDNILRKVLPIFENKKFDNFNFKIISGKFNNKKFKKFKIKNYKVYKSLSQKKYLEILSKSEFYITSGGVSVWEGLAFKKKMLVISTANNQLKNLNHLKENKLINYIGSSKKFTYKKNIRKIDDFFFKNDLNLLIKNINKFKIAQKFKYFINMVRKNYET